MKLHKLYEMSYQFATWAIFSFSLKIYKKAYISVFEQ